MAESTAPSAADAPVAGTSLWKDAYKRLRKNRLAVVGFIVVCIIVAAAAVGPTLIERTTGYTYDYIPSDPALVNAMPPFTAPDGSFAWTHPMGTDDAGRDILAGLKNIVGGELKAYTELLVESRKEAVARMVQQAEAVGANAVVNVRFSTSNIASGAAEVMAYGTAVVIG